MLNFDPTASPSSTMSRACASEHLPVRDISNTNIVSTRLPVSCRYPENCSSTLRTPSSIMANPRIEEVDDDIAEDPDEMDVDAFDFARPAQGGLQPSMDPAASQMTPEAIQAMLQGGMGGMGGQPNMQRPPQMSEKDRLQRERETHERTKSYQCIYPIYFDSSRSREEGRRVKKENAVPNPLAREIADALQWIGNSMSIPLQIVFEPHKSHPKDWGNPGRVRAGIKQSGKPVSAKIANKHHLYTLISKYLKDHPTTADMAMRYRPAGMPPMKDTPPAPAVPRGFKIGGILPLHSPALSGGGVNDNFLKDMMSEMGGQLPPGMEGMAQMAQMAGGGGGGGGAPQGQKKVKDKKKK